MLNRWKIKGNKTQLLIMRTTLIMESIMITDKLQNYFIKGGY